METEIVAKAVLDCAYKVHTHLGPGLFESAYEECLYYELSKAGIAVEKQKILPFLYFDLEIKAGYRLDLLVENKVVVEIKSIDSLKDIHTSQILTYLRLIQC
ncbi:GxxExxY protein [Litoribacter ruber]|uniref:GxxExxY protein n=1 Tax=Litoribacter ruber TaxID=702568 RepID=UPI00293D2920|nr:GxxExxY protein [Litoribacter ruber]